MRNLSTRRARLPFNLLYAAILPLLLLALVARLFLSKRRLVGLREKLSGNDKPTEPGCVMIHGVSMGEVMLMRPLLPILEELFGQRCLVTTSTETGWDAAKKAFPDRERRFFPFDAPWAVNRFLSLHKPSRVILLELEIWPNFMLACKERGIPVQVLNARITGRSFKRYLHLRPLLRRIFATPKPWLAQNTLWANRLRALGAEDVRVTGSIKSDLVRIADRASIVAERIRLGIANDDRPVFLIASTSDGEEEALIRSFTKWGEDWRLIICPRHPERGTAIAATCQTLGLDAVCTTDAAWPLQTEAQQAIIVNEIGRMNDLYGMTELCCVGGSFGSGRHGQNMLEPAAAGRCTVVGWDTSNFRDAMALLLQTGGVIQTTANDLDATLHRLANDPAERLRIGNAGRLAWQSDRGALERIVEELKKDLSCSC